MTEIRSDSDTPPILPPIFLQGSISAKFGITSAEVLQFRNEATHLKRETSTGSAKESLISFPNLM